MAKKRQAIKCHGHNTDGSPCGRYAMIGQMVCYKHGGASEASCLAGADRVAQEKAAQVLARMDVQPVTNSLAELQWIAGINHAWIETAASLVNALKAEEIRYPGSVRGEQLRAEIGILERSISQAVITNSAIARIHVDERLIAIKEGKAEMMSSALYDSLTEAGLTPEQATAVRKGFARRLRLLPDVA